MFSFMGHNVDLNPANTSGWAVFNFRTTGTTMVLLHQPASSSSTVPWVTLAVLDDAFHAERTVQCLSNDTITVCPLPQLAPNGSLGARGESAAAAAVHVECRITAPKTTVFHRVHFS